MSITPSQLLNNHITIPNIPRTGYPDQLNDQKIKKVALNTLAILSVAAGVTLIGLGVASIITPGAAFLSIPLFLGAAACFHYARQQRNSIAPEQLHQIKLDANAMTFSEIIKKFSVKETFERKIQSPEEMKAKLLKEASTSSFAEFKQKIPRSKLAELCQYKIIDQRTFESLDTLYGHSAICDSLFMQQKLNLLAKYPQSKESLLENTQSSSKPIHSMQTDPDDDAGYTAGILKANRERAENLERFNENFKALFKV
ncbi:MAG: hypothetical protein FJZ57_06940 [Chlamydiae bacterium]|nr:hypothetical protein [Chlamydiota bacterium]